MPYDLPVELREGKERLKAALLALNEEESQKRTAHSNSVRSVLARIVYVETLALSELCDAGSAAGTNRHEGADIIERFPAPDESNQSLDSLLREFEAVRTAILRCVDSASPWANVTRDLWRRVRELCVVRFNEQIEELDNWQESEIEYLSTNNYL